MPDEVDPYRQWLGRTETERPLNHYQLLGLQDFEDDRRRLENAEMIEMAKVLRHEAGPHAALAKRVCQELEQAVATLGDSGKKAAYDAHLRELRSAPVPSNLSSAPNYYQLLGLADFEDNRSRIENAEMIELAKILRMESGPQAAEAAQLRQQLDRAVATLTDPIKKNAYDAQLRSPRPDGSKAAAPDELPPSVVVDRPASRLAAVVEKPAAAQPNKSFASDLKLNDEDDDLLDIASTPRPTVQSQRSPLSPLPQPAAPSRHDFAADLKLDDSEPDDLSVPVRQSMAATAALPAASAVADAETPPQSAPVPAIDDAQDDLSERRKMLKQMKKKSTVAAAPAQGQQAVAAPRPLLSKRVLPPISPRQLATAMGGLAVVAVLGWAAWNWLNRAAGTGRVAGAVTIKSEPVASAEMSFVSTTNADNAFVGISRRDGQYQVSYRTLHGLPVGRYKVTITTLTPVSLQPPASKSPTADEGESGTEGDGAIEGVANLVATSYVFEHEIVEGDNRIDFELSSGQKVDLKPAD